MKKNCYNCKHRRELDYSAHSRCAFRWKSSDKTPPKAHERGIKMGWYSFPYNYDPVWQKEECEAFEEKTNK